jgi:NADPH:quinone reductase-like Zn-dependent oxidoreductase
VSTRLRSPPATNFILRGSPWAGTPPFTGLRKPRKNYVPGQDLAGQVEAAGSDVERLQTGDSVFGASRGTFAIQIARALGAEVTGVCSARYMEMVRMIGADHVIDYTR